MENEYGILLAIGALLILSPLVKSLMERLGVPALVGYILLGVILSLANEQRAFITETFDTIFSVLAQLGVVALLFRVGLKSHTRVLLAKLPDASLIWVGDVVASLALGFVISRYVLDLSIETSLVVTTALSATSVAVSVAVWDELHKLRTSNGQLLVDVAELDDLSAVLLLTVLVAVFPVLHGEGGELLPSLGATVLWVLVKLTLFITGCFLFSHYLEPGFTRFNRRWESSKTGLTITILGTGLAIAAVAGYLGFSLAIGALFAGLAFSRDPQAVNTDGRFVYFYEFFTPFFFIHIGMQIDPEAVIPALWFAAILFFPSVAGKFLGVFVPALRVVKSGDAILLGLSMIPRAEITMVVVYQCKGLRADIVPDNVFAAIVLVSVASAIFAPLLLRHLMSSRNVAH